MTPVTPHKNRDTNPKPDKREVPIAGEVLAVTFFSEDTGFGILSVNDSDLGKITVTGTFPTIAKGCIVTGTGSAFSHPKYGPQYKLTDVRVEAPRSTNGIIQYLQSEIFTGIGPTLAKRLVDKFGPQTLETIRTRADLVARVPGLNKKKAADLAEQANASVHVEAIITWLMENDCGAANAFKVYKQFGPESIDVLSRNPWVLADEVHGIGFDTADRIALKLGLGGSHPLRIAAGLRHVVAQQEKAGHTAAPLQTVIEAVAKLLLVNAANQAITAALNALFEDERRGLVRYTKLDDTIWVQSASMARLEARIAEALINLSSKTRLRWSTSDAFARLDRILAESGFDASPDQIAALKTIVSNPLTLLVGGPGSGKTTTTNIAVKTLRSLSPTLRIKACAPTGKAAARLSEQTGLEATTIHRLIGAGVGGIAKYNRHDPVPVDILIVDESSMLDTLMTAKLLDALPTTCIVLFIGDRDQIPSIGPGSILSDFIATKLIKEARLTTIHRQAAGSQIIQNAYAIRDGRLADIKSGHDFSIVQYKDSEEMAEGIVSIVTTDAPALGFAPHEVQVITGGHRGATGTASLNNLLQRALNPEGDEYPTVKIGPTTFKVGDRVIITKNNYDLNVFNGSMGVIQSIYEDGTITAQIDGEQVVLTKAQANILSLSYALTVHKCQGSEFPCVVLVVDTAHFTLLDRNWFFTGETRPRKMCFLAAVPRAVGIAVRNVAARQRTTTVVDRCLRQAGHTGGETSGVYA